ncbi:hypothetical protein B0G57_107249 [Trinickia symbiotica]|nr:hypothetical protein B0G57_107249 [Trinickia symbiotica]
MNVDAAPANDGLAALDRCLNGKIVRMMTTCDDARWNNQDADPRAAQTPSGV